MDERTYPEDLDRDLSVKEFRILLAMQAAGGEAQMSDITDATEMSNHLVNHYLKNEGKLIDLGLVKHIAGDRSEGIPRRGYTYALTDQGHDVLVTAQEDYSLTPLEEGEVRRRFDDLGKRMGRVEQRLDQVVAEAAGNSKTIDEYDEKIDEHDEMIQGLGRAGKAVLRRVEELEAKVTELKDQ